MKPWVRFFIFSILVAIMTAVCISRGLGRTESPDGWTRDTRKQPFVSQSVLASGPQAWNVWSLAAYQGFVSEQPANQIAVDMTLPESGRVTLTTNHTASGSGLLLAVGSPPKGIFRQADGEDLELECTGSLPPLVPGRIQVNLTQNDTGWSAVVGDQTLTCTATDSASNPSITAGLRRVSIHSISAGTVRTGPGTSAMIWGVGAGAAWFAILFGIGRKAPTFATVMGLASISGWIFIPIDGAYLAEMLRLIGVRADHLPLTFSMVKVAVVTATGLSIRGLKASTLSAQYCRLWPSFWRSPNCGP